MRGANDDSLGRPSSSSTTTPPAWARPSAASGTPRARSRVEHGLGAAGLEGSLPDATGRHLVFAGLGYPAPSATQEPAAPAARKALTSIWIGVCQRMGAASCEAIDGPLGQDPPESANQVTPTGLNQITTACVGQFSIDVELTFAPGSDRLTTHADTVLGPLVEQLVRCPAGARVDAIGYSALLPGVAPGSQGTSSPWWVVDIEPNSRGQSWTPARRSAATELRHDRQSLGVPANPAITPLTQHLQVLLAGESNL